MRRLAYYLGPDLLLFSGFALLMLGLNLVYRGQLSPVANFTVILPLLVMLGLVTVSMATRAEVIRDWLPLVLLALVYEIGHDQTDLVRKQVMDGTLRRLDEALFSVVPALALQRITRPWLTELMTLAYALYFFYPITILTIFYRRREFIRFREFGVAVSLAFYLGLIGYVLVPAIGPRYYMPGEFTVPLTGLLLTAPAAAAWNAVESIQRDCFPSLHCSITLLSLIYLVRHRREWRYGGVMLAIWVPLIAALWLSTLYLRYHYAVDVLAGWALAYLCSRLAPAFTRRYYLHVARRA